MNFQHEQTVNFVSSQPRRFSPIRPPTLEHRQILQQIRQGLHQEYPKPRLPAPPAELGEEEQMRCYLLVLIGMVLILPGERGVV